MRTYSLDALIFDIDGTLFQTETVALPAFRTVFEELQQQKLYSGDVPGDDAYLSVFGMTIPEVWETLLPAASMDVRDRANERLLHHQLALLNQNTGRLYDGVADTLRTLHAHGLRLYTASNGEERYCQAVLKNGGIADLFTNIYSASAYQTEKKEDLVAIVLREQQLTADRAIMVGDRESDIVAGHQNKLLTIGCRYGFAKPGELDRADEQIHTFSDLPSLLENLQKVK